MKRENQCKRIARFRLKNEVGEEKYWKGEDEMRLCGGGGGTWRQVCCKKDISGLEEEGSWQEAHRWVV